MRIRNGEQTLEKSKTNARSPENLTTSDRVHKFSQIERESRRQSSAGKSSRAEPENYREPRKNNYNSGSDLIVEDSSHQPKKNGSPSNGKKYRFTSPQNEPETELVHNQINTKHMETFGQPVSYNLKFDPYRKNAPEPSKLKRDSVKTEPQAMIEEQSDHTEEEQILVESSSPKDNFGKNSDPSSDDFVSFGHSVSTHRVYNNLAKMFTQLENSIKNPILLSALVVIESESVLVTGGSNDRTLRFWSILAKESGYTLRCEHELKIFNKSITNIQYIENRQVVVAGDSQLLIMFDMTSFFADKRRSPDPIVQLLNSHWLRCIFHHYTKSHDWLITAKNMSLFYYDFDRMENITPRIVPDKFEENIMCFETIDDQHVMVGNGKSISFLQIASGKQVGESRRDHEKLINNILYVRKRRYVLSGGDDGFIFLYKLNSKQLTLNIIQKVSPSGSTPKSFIDSLVYFEEQSMLFCTNRTKSLTIFCFNRNNLLKEKSKITELKFKVTGLYFWRKQVSLLAYSSLVPNIIILGFAGVNINN